MLCPRWLVLNQTGCCKLAFGRIPEGSSPKNPFSIRFVSNENPWGESGFGALTAESGFDIIHYIKRGL